MGLLGKLIAGKVVAKAVQKVKQKEALRAQQGQYIPAGASVARPPATIAGKAVAFYEKNPKLVAGAATLLMAALAASLSKGRGLR
jgi:hypothetical protein